MKAWCSTWCGCLKLASRRSWPRAAGFGEDGDGRRLPVTRQLGYARDRRRRQRRPSLETGARNRSALGIWWRLPLVRDPGLRATFTQGRPLLKGLPAGWHRQPEREGDHGRYVRIELPGKQRTLTLAEVEVFSDGHNVARQGKASQKNTGYSGDASQAIDGDTSGNFGHGTETHAEKTSQTPGGKWTSEAKCRSTRLPSSTAPMEISASGSMASRSRCSIAPRRRSLGKNQIPAPAEKGVRIRRRVAGRLGPPRGHEGPGLGPGQGSGRVQGLAPFVKKEADRTRRSEPCSASRRPIGPRKRRHDPERRAELM